MRNILILIMLVAFAVPPRGEVYTPDAETRIEFIPDPVVIDSVEEDLCEKVVVNKKKRFLNLFRRK